MTITSGKDTNITGSEVKGDKVVANIGGNLNIASVQDTDNYTAKNQSSGFGVTTQRVDGKPLPAGNFGPINQVTTIGLTGSISKGKTDSTYASVTDQAGIFAGKEGFDINVGKNTDLKGAVIASTAMPDKNKISTGTLTYSDIQNKADYSASSTGIGYSWSAPTAKDANGKDIQNPNNGFSSTPGMLVSGDASSTTKSAIEAGTTITITGKQTQDLSGLSRDTGNSLNTLGKIFDKKTVAEQQELTKVFGEEAFKAVGDLALSQYKKALADKEKYKDKKESPEYKDALVREVAWHDGGANKILLHSIAGGIMSSLGGGSFASGATSAGINEAVQNELAKIKDTGLHQLASAAIGAAASKLVGGNSQTGASVAASATKNNWLNHYQQEKMAALLNAAKSMQEKENIIAYYTALSQYNVDNNPKSIKDWEAIEQDLLTALSGVTSNTKNGLNLSLNELTVSIFGVTDTANIYRAAINLYGPSYNPFEDLSTQVNSPLGVGLTGISKGSSVVLAPTVDSLLMQGGKWNSSGQVVGPDGTLYSTLMNRGDYLHQKGIQPDSYDATGRPCIHVDDGDYPIYTLPTRGDELASQSNAQFTKIDGQNYVVDENGKPWYTTKEPPQNVVIDTGKYMLGFGKGLKNKVDEIPEFILKSDPKQIDAFIAKIPSQLQSAWDEGLENTVVNVGGKVYKVTLENWEKQYSAIQTIADPEERGMKTAKLMVDIGTTVAAVRSAGKMVTSFTEFGTIDEAKAALNNENGAVRIPGGANNYERLIPGSPNLVTGGDSTKLGKNMMESMDLTRSTKWSGYQAQHIIPAEMRNNPIIQKIGMDFDNATNGIFLRVPDEEISAMSRHRGYHSIYNEVVGRALNKMDVNQSVDVLQKQVYDLQQNLKSLQQNGLPLYPSQGATVELWEREMEKLSK